MSTGPGTAGNHPQDISFPHLQAGLFLHHPEGGGRDRGEVIQELQLCWLPVLNYQSPSFPSSLPQMLEKEGAELQDSSSASQVLHLTEM